MACAQNQPIATDPSKALLTISDSGGKKTILTQVEVVPGKATRDEFYFTYTLETDYTENGDAYKTVASYTCQMYHVKYGEYRVMERLDSLLRYVNGMQVGEIERSEVYTHVGYTSQKQDTNATAIRVWNYMKKRGADNQIAEAEKNALLVLDRKENTISYVPYAGITPLEGSDNFTLSYSTAWILIDKDNVQGASSSFDCNFIKEENGIYRIEKMMNSKSFYTNGQPSGHAHPSGRYILAGYSDNDSLLEVKLWKLLSSKL